MLVNVSALFNILSTSGFSPFCSLFEYFSAFLMVEISEDNIPLAFMGINYMKLEMLFVSAQEREKGIGTKLIQYGKREYSINEWIQMIKTQSILY